MHNHLVARRGSVLIIIAGLCTILLTLSITFLVKMRIESEESILMVRDAQARIMLVAACQYLQESSRLGWRNPNAKTSDRWGDGSPGYETYGWTDVRDGGLGPRGPRYHNPGTDPLDPAFPVPLRQGLLPIPTWWPAAIPNMYPKDTDGKAFNGFVYDEVTNLPSGTGRKWPCPGSAMRGDMFVQVVPPYAIRMQKVMNPFYATGAEFTTPEYAKFMDGPYNVGDRAAHRAVWDGGSFFDNATQTWISTGTGTFTASWQKYFAQWRGEGYGGLDPQPVEDTWAAFETGTPTPRTTSTNLSWFRIYRELPSDHNNDGSPWYDHVPLGRQNQLAPQHDYENHGIFIITCGAGATQGYRFWNASDPGYLPELEPLTAEDSGLFVDQQMFRDLRATERILWYRVEWSANSGGGVDSPDHYGDQPYALWLGQVAGTDGGSNYSSLWDYQIDNHVVSFFGGFKWIQRLEKDPIKW
ncbi:MAG: hypothetical protein H0V44_09930 [Planctomycetes bacterium]|nr:hypothetical protein [Planctomycetota bacterium]